jgi:chromosome segregation ATPase
MKLQDRQASLDGLKDDVKKHMEALKALMAGLDKLERQMPRESFPQNRDDADKLLRLVRNIQESLYDLQPGLDSLRNKTDDLVKRQGNVPGAVELQDRVLEAGQRWNELQLACKDRCSFLDGLKEFHDSCENFAAWLSAKDKMMSVLGPIAADPRVVNTQLQQVQVLRDEFNNQFAQLENLNKLGSEMLQRLDPNSPDARKITEKLNHLNQRWDALLARLDERHAALGAAAGAAKDFNSLLTQIQNALEKVSDEFDELGPVGGDFEGQLKKLEKLDNDLDRQRGPLAEAAGLGEHLSKVLADAASRNDIKNMLSQAERMHTQLQRKLDNRRAELELSLRDEREFSDTCEGLLGWLQDALDHLSDKLLVSAEESILRNQVEQFEPLYKEIMSREHEVIMLTNKGKDLTAKGSVRDARTLQKNLDLVLRQWDKLKREAAARHTRLQTCMDHCKRFVTGQSFFLPWLTQAEEKLLSLGAISFRKHDVERQLKEVQSFKNDLSRHAQEYENNKANAEALLAACDKDKDGVKEDVKSMRNRWDRLNNGILDRLQALEDVAARLQHYNDKAKDVGHQLQRIEDRLASHDALGDASKDPKLLERIKGLADELRKLENPLIAVDSLGEELCNAADAQGSDSRHIQDELDGLKHRHANLSKGLQDRCRDLERASAAVNQVKDQVKLMTVDLGNLEEELDAMKPVARDLNTLQRQLDEVNTFQRKVDQKADVLENTVDMCKNLERDGYTMDAKVAKEQLDGLRKQLSRLQDRTRARKDDVSNVLTKMDTFYGLHGDLLKEINGLAREVNDFKAIGGDVETIRAQQRDFNNFTKTKMDPVGQHVDKCSRQGQGLVQSAPSGVNTQKLESDIDQLNDKWNNLKEKLNERQRRLDFGLLNCGKFKEALNGLAKWLSDTEDMVASQKPPSADYNVVKAQMQEQKYLNKMLLDRQHSMDSVNLQGQEVAANAEPSERKQIENQASLTLDISKLIIWTGMPK